MAYFNPVTTLDELVTTTFIRNGKTEQVQAKVRRCMGLLPDGQGACRRCWVTFEQAKFCAMRGHTDEFIEMYGDTGFKRTMLRRDQAPVASAPAPAPSGPSAPPSPPQALTQVQPSEAEVRAMALALGFRLSRIPVKASKVSVPEPDYDDYDEGSAEFTVLDVSENLPF